MLLYRLGFHCTHVSSRLNQVRPYSVSVQGSEGQPPGGAGTNEEVQSEDGSDCESDFDDGDSTESDDDDSAVDENEFNTALEFFRFVIGCNGGQGLSDEATAWLFKLLRDPRLDLEAIRRWRTKHAVLQYGLRLMMARRVYRQVEVRIPGIDHTFELMCTSPIEVQFAIRVSTCLCPPFLLSTLASVNTCHCPPLPLSALATVRPCHCPPLPLSALATVRPCLNPPLPLSALASVRHCLNPPLPQSALASIRPCLISPLPHSALASFRPCLNPPLPHFALASLRPCLIPPLPHSALASFRPCLTPPLPHSALASFRPCLISPLPHFALASFRPCLCPPLTLSALAPAQGVVEIFGHRDNADGFQLFARPVHSVAGRVYTRPETGLLWEAAQVSCTQQHGSQMPCSLCYVDRGQLRNMTAAASESRSVDQQSSLIANPRLARTYSTLCVASFLWEWNFSRTLWGNTYLSQMPDILHIIYLGFWLHLLGGCPARLSALAFVRPCLCPPLPLFALASSLCLVPSLLCPPLPMPVLASVRTCLFPSLPLPDLASSRPCLFPSLPLPVLALYALAYVRPCSVRPLPLHALALWVLALSAIAYTGARQAGLLTPGDASYWVSGANFTASEHAAVMMVRPYLLVYGLLRVPNARDGCQMGFADYALPVWQIVPFVLEGEVEVICSRTIVAFLDWHETFVRAAEHTDESLSAFDTATRMMVQLVESTFPREHSGWNLVKVHLLLHLTEAIRRGGLPREYSAAVYENAHIRTCKRPYRRSNHRDVGRVIAQHNTNAALLTRIPTNLEGDRQYNTAMRRVRTHIRLPNVCCNYACRVIPPLPLSALCLCPPLPLSALCLCPLFASVHSLPLSALCFCLPLASVRPLLLFAPRLCPPFDSVRTCPLPLSACFFVRSRHLPLSAHPLSPFPACPRFRLTGLEDAHPAGEAVAFVRQWYPSLEDECTGCMRMRPSDDELSYDLVPVASVHRTVHMVESFVTPGLWYLNRWAGRCREELP
ncbi:unnamed protein product [Closterium sp. NIES-53]